MLHDLDKTVAYDSYWKFAAERQAVYHRRFSNPHGPWTEDPILRSYRFTNSFRVADKVSQYLVREVQYRSDRSQAPSELFFRTLLFKIFNRIETWELLERTLGRLSWQSADFNAISATLDEAMRRGTSIYSAAYIMPSPNFGQPRKHSNHLVLLQKMMEDGLPAKMERAESLSSVYEMLRPWPGLGNFLAFQYAIDLNYSSLLSFEEASFVIAGPGALDGISKCFVNSEGHTAEAIIYMMVDAQEREFARLGIDFPGLFGRRLQPIDCQNLFCEISKYSRVAHPEIAGRSGRTKIKQGYSGAGHLERPFFPPRWGLDVPPIISEPFSPIQAVLI